MELFDYLTVSCYDYGPKINHIVNLYKISLYCHNMIKGTISYPDKNIHINIDYNYNEDIINSLNNYLIFNYGSFELINIMDLFKEIIKLSRSIITMYKYIVDIYSINSPIANENNAYDNVNRAKEIILKLEKTIDKKYSYIVNKITAN